MMSHCYVSISFLTNSSQGHLCSILHLQDKDHLLADHKMASTPVIVWATLVLVIGLVFAIPSASSQPTPPGGEKPINRSDPGVTESANSVVGVVNQDRGYADIITRVSLGEIIDGTVQITDGNVYRLHFSIGDSVCNNSIVNWNVTSKECPLVHPALKQRYCNATIIYKHWEFPRCKISYFTCQPPPPGDQRPIDRSDSDVKLSTEAAISIINYERGYSNTTYRRMLFEIEGGTEQITDGELYRLIFTIADSDCKNIEPYFNATSKQCPIPGGRFPVQRCEAEVLDRNWLPNRWFIQQNKCSYIPSPPLPPPVEPINRSDPGVAASVNAAVNDINKDRGYADIITRESLGEIINGTVEITAPNQKTYRLWFTVGNSVCNNSIYNAHATSVECPLIRTDRGLHTCKTTVLYTHGETSIAEVLSYHCLTPPGDEHPINKSDPVVWEAADTAVDVINWDRGYSDLTRRLTIFGIESGTMQVVSGEMYKLVFTLSNSVCKNTEANANATSKECPRENGLQGLPVQRCESQILYRHWLTPKSDVMEHSCVTLPPPIVPPGGQKPINRSDPGVAEAVLATVEVINLERGYADIIIRQSLGQVLGGTVQVVGGEEYRLVFTIGNSVCNNSIVNANSTTETCPLVPGIKLRLCNTTVLYKNWETPRSSVLSYVCEGPAPGDQVRINKTDPGVIESLDSAIDAINKARGYTPTRPRLSLYELEGGTVQVVDGDIYRLVFTLSNSICANTEEHANATSDTCPPRSGELGLPVVKCESKILYQHWLDPPTAVMENICDKIPLRPAPPGSVLPYSKSDPFVIMSVNAVVDVINQDNGYSDTIPRESLAEILNGTQQLVDGILFHLSFSIGESVCPNTEANANATTKECPLKSRLMPRVCLALAEYRFLGAVKIQVLNWECEKSVRVKRDLFVTDHYIKMSADFAANQVNKENGYSCCTYKYVVKDTANVSSMLVQKGTAVSMVIHLGESFCTNNELNKDRTVDDCPLQPGSVSPVITCSVTMIINNGHGFTLGSHNCTGGAMSTASPVIVG